LALYGPGDADNAPTQQAPMTGGKAAVAVGGVRRGGVWHVRVEGPGRAEVKYGVEVEIVPPCPVDDKLEENDSLEAAKEVKEPQKGLKACPGDPDWYRVEVPKTEAMQATIAYDVKRAPLRAALYDQHGTLVVEGRESAGGIGLGIPQLEKKPEPKDDKGKKGQPADDTPEPPPETQTWFIEVAAATDEENNYALQVQPPSDGGKDQNQDQQDQEQDQKDKDQGDQDQDQKDKDKQDQGDKDNDQEKKDQKQPEPKPQEQQVDLDKLIDALDKHPKNPQLEKALRGLQVVPRMEDY
ncbi:MAG: hypothetical protein KC613_05750, partial [Myxococcales bacterium]|nr:hypothetical protein [Myxococcales bacterium]